MMAAMTMVNDGIDDNGSDNGDNGGNCNDQGWQ